MRRGNIDSSGALKDFLGLIGARWVSDQGRFGTLLMFFDNGLSFRLAGASPASWARSLMQMGVGMDELCWNLGVPEGHALRNMTPEAILSCLSHLVPQIVSPARNELVNGAPGALPPGRFRIAAAG